MALSAKQKTGLVIGVAVAVTFVAVVLMRSGTFGKKVQSAEAKAESKINSIVPKSSTQ